MPLTLRIPYSVSPTPTLSPAPFLILMLPVVTPFESVGKKFDADLSFPESSISFLALSDVPLHQNPSVAVSKSVLAILKPLYNFWRLGVKVSLGSTLNPAMA